MKGVALSALTVWVLLLVGFCNGLLFTDIPSDDFLVPENHQARFGLGVIYGTMKNQRLMQQVGADWYINWTAEPEFDSDAVFWPMLRVRPDGTYIPTGDSLRKAVKKSPDAVWIIGNEPDIAEQDNVSPLAFAIAFHDARQEILQWDDSARFAIGAVGRVSPLRLAYLDITLGIYRQRYGQDMPIDVWTIHHYLLPEQKNAWGVGIPKTLPAAYGDLLMWEHHNNTQFFMQGIETFRQWMKVRGFQNSPLMVTEFGLLLPGFPAVVYLEKTVSYLLYAQDKTIGYPADDGHLVQGFGWFALRDPVFRTGTLVHLYTSTLTPAGERWRALYDKAGQ